MTGITRGFERLERMLDAQASVLDLQVELENMTIGTPTEPRLYTEAQLNQLRKQGPEHA